MAQSCSPVTSPRHGFIVKRLPTKAGRMYGFSLTSCSAATYAGMLDVFADSLDVYLTSNFRRGLL